MPDHVSVAQRRRLDVLKHITMILRPGSSWIRVGFELDSSWIRVGFELDSSWIRVEFELDSSWIRVGFELNSRWIHEGFEYSAHLFPLVTVADLLRQFGQVRVPN